MITSVLLHAGRVLAASLAPSDRGGAITTDRRQLASEGHYSQAMALAPERERADWPRRV